MTARRTIGSLVMLVVVSIALSAYLVVGVLHLHPFTRYDTVSLDLTESNGLQNNSSVLYNGIQVGTVTDLRTGPDGLRATLRIRPGADVPADATVSIANLSMVGEQYVEFTSTTGSGPYLTDGAVIGNGIDPGVSVADMLTSMHGLTSQFDPATLEEIARTISEGWQGRDADLATIGRFSSLTARTIGTYRSEFSGLFDHAQELLTRLDGARIGAVMRATAPKLAHMNIPFSTLWSLLPGLAQATEGATGWYDVIIPFTQKIGEYLNKTMPDVAAIMRVLQPTLTAVAPAGRVNLATLVEQGLRIVDENGVLRLTVADPP
ncbi:Mce family protein [Gordonia polyisoprenivorans NBRC 16320 = JCM 10675]|uniref:MCE family protein n=1 Tax=Gordonia polyisoprenivorans TaxID=84595 RepID=A0A846WRA8_9ACTN|nr:MlaD family protein [Gordonia polyisoprenivorans]NKY04085.1 MCE family protein [Gordonia polyisoprenivorans]GAB26085.1 Mce family protein [Gordonia polyisoprenivorans NBRC 16320 = JCM 10675]